MFAYTDFAEYLTDATPSKLPSMASITAELGHPTVGQR